MSIEFHRLQRLRVYEEPDVANFGVDHTGTMADYLDVPFVSGSASLTLTKDQLPSETVQQFLDGYAKDVAGKKAATLQFTMILAPNGQVANSGASSLTENNASNWALGRILKAIMGGLRGAVAGSNVASATANGATITVSGGHGTRFTAGAAYAWANSAGILEAREIKTVSSDTITPKLLHSATPTGSNTIYNSTTIYLDDSSTALQFVLEGNEQSDRWLLSGVNGSFTLDLPIGGLPRITFNLIAAEWSNLSDSALGSASYPTHNPVAFFNSEFQAQVVATTTRNPLNISQISFTPNIVYSAVPSPEGKNTVYRWKRINNGSPSATVQYTTYYQAYSEFFQERDDRDDYNHALRIGSAAGGIILLTVPCGQVSDVQRVADSAGTAAQVVTAKARLDTDATDQTTAIRRSAFRGHWI